MPSNPLSWPGYLEQLAAARERTGQDEAVTTDVERLGDVEAVAIRWNFDFLGGSVGAGTGAWIIGAYDRARRDGLPVVLFTATGGSRMQEGMASLVQMPAAVVARRRHAEAGLLQVAVLGHPTTGGIFASFANLAHVTFAVEGATIGFAGPRVAEALAGSPLPSGSHTAAGAVAAGLADRLVAPDQVEHSVAQALAWTIDSRPVAVEEPPDPQRQQLHSIDPWEAFEHARDPGRPRAQSFLDGIDVAVELRGDRAGTDDPTVRVVLATVLGRRAVVVAMDRASNDARITPAGYRKAWRGISMAEELGVPLVTLIDTPGADASAASEAGGIAHHIARTFDAMLSCPVPTVSLVVGEGGSGGALALAATDVLLMQEHATFSVIAPEGAAAILHRDAERAPEVARLLDPTAIKLRDLAIADGVVPEPAGSEVETAWQWVAGHLDRLASRMADELVDRRQERWHQPMSGTR